MFVFILYFCDVLTNGISTISVFKLYYLMRCVPFLLLLAYFIRNRAEASGTLFKYVYLILIFQFYINAPFIFYQFTQDVFFDDATGFFGNRASHIANYAWLFIILFQLIRSTNLLVLLFDLIIMFVLAFFIENKAFYWFSIVLILLYHFSSLFSIKNIFKSVIISTTIIIIGINILASLPKEYQYVLKGLKIGYDTYILKNRKDERTEMLDYALSKEDSFFFGKGCGSISHAFFIKGSLIEEVPAHLSMSDSTTIIYENGIFFYMSIIVLFTLLFYNFFIRTHVINNLLRFIILFLIVHYNMHYGNLLSDPRTFFLFAMIIALFAWKRNRDTKIQQVPN